jgi:hypothetical protein
MPISSPKLNFENSFHPAVHLVSYAVNAQKMQVNRRVRYLLFFESLTRTKFEFFFIKFREIPVISSRDVTHEQGPDGQSGITGSIQGCEKT